MSSKAKTFISNQIREISAAIFFRNKTTQLIFLTSLHTYRGLNSEEFFISISIQGLLFRISKQSELLHPLPAPSCLPTKTIPFKYPEILSAFYPTKSRLEFSWMASIPFNSPIAKSSISLADREAFLSGPLITKSLWITSQFIIHPQD